MIKPHQFILIFIVVVSAIYASGFIFRSVSCDIIGKPLPPSEIEPYIWKNTGLITLWFDDGWDSQYSAAYPIMQQENMRGAISVITNFVCKPAFVSWRKLHALQNSGWETTAHTVTHNCDLGYYVTNAQFELKTSKKIIQDHGLRADQFVIPCGYSKTNIENVLGDKEPILLYTKQYFESFRTTKVDRLNPIPVPDPYNLKALQVRHTTSIEQVQTAIDNAMINRKWLILVFHQIDDSGQPLSISVDRFKAVIDLVKQSGLPVVLPAEVLSIN